MKISILIAILLILKITQLSICSLTKNNKSFIKKKNIKGADNTASADKNTDKNKPHWSKYLHQYCKNNDFCNQNSGQLCFGNTCYAAMFGKCNTDDDCLKTNLSHPYLKCDMDPNPKKVSDSKEKDKTESKICIANKAGSSSKDSKKS